MKSFFLNTFSPLRSTARFWVLVALLTSMELSASQLRDTEQAVAMEESKCADCVEGWGTGIGAGEIFAQVETVPTEARVEQIKPMIERISPYLGLVGFGLAFIGVLWLTYLLKKDRQTKVQLAFQARRSNVLLELPQYADRLSEVE